MNTYTQAVQYLEDYVAATDAIFEDGTLPGVEKGVQFALKILREQSSYEGPAVQ